MFGKEIFAEMLGWKRETKLLINMRSGAKLLKSGMLFVLSLVI